ncbi:putative ArsR family transcriptional regulator [Natrinema thermotolerans DSM 11552]|nr:putative ArsR family transcriptional regulator [Natrinema thermotolerans DSM 11552]
MDRERTEPAPDDLVPADAFSLLGHDRRVDILRALLEASRTGDEYPASFSTLREQVGAEVSAQFNYHLGELTGHFVRRTDDGYELRYAGWAVATSILEGTYNRRAAFGPEGIAGRCPHCGAETLVASYREEWLTIECGACDDRLVRYPFPPGGLESRSLPDVLEAFDRRVRSHVALARDGVCPACTGPMAVTVPSLVDGDASTDSDGDDAAPEDDPIATFRCRRCGNRLRPEPGLVLLEHERVVRFAAERGRSLSATPFWELEWCVSGDAASVTATEPWRCTVSIPVGDESLLITVDDEFAVQSATVESAEPDR